MKNRIFTAVFIITAVTIVFMFSCKTAATAKDEPAAIIAETSAGLTTEQEYYFGRAVSANILSAYKVWNGNTQLTNYLNLICGAVAINSPRPNIYNGYRVAILDTNEVNAFSTSAGHIFLTRGLVNAIKSEDALAALLAHEIAHIQLKHSITQVLLEIESPNNYELAAIFNEAAAETATMIAARGYSTEQEFESDIFALNLMAYAGYNPKSYLDMLRDLYTAQSRSRGGLNNTHPAPDHRQANIETLIESFDMPDTRVHRQIRFGSAVMAR